VCEAGLELGVVVVAPGKVGIRPRPRLVLPHAVRRYRNMQAWCIAWREGGVAYKDVFSVGMRLEVERDDANERSQFVPDVGWAGGWNEQRSTPSNVGDVFVT
jgi:hypothetical protein